MTSTLGFNGVVIGGGPVYIGEGIEGLAGAPVRMGFTPSHNGGSWGGRASAAERTITADAWVDIAELNGPNAFEALWAIEAAMDHRPDPFDELPLTINDLTFPVPCDILVRPAGCEWLADEDGVHGGAPGLDLRWVGADASIYRVERQLRDFGAPGAPVASVNYDVVNVGRKRARSPRATQFRMTAHTTLVRPYLRVEHVDGTVEQIRWEVTLSPGQVLTVDERRRVRIGSQEASGRIRSLNADGTASNAPRWPVWHPGINDVTVGAQSGTFTGFLRTRSTP